MSAGLALFLGLAGGCATTTPWTEQLTPGGPCYAVNLLDGLDTASTQEAHDLFDCLDANGTLAGYRPLDAALDAPTRDGAMGLVVARWIADAPSQLPSVSLGGVLDGAREALAAPDDLRRVTHVGVELVYGVPYADAGTSVPLNASSSLDAGLLVPALPVVGVVSASLLDEGLAPLETVATLLRSERLPRVAWTLASAMESDDPALAPLGASWAFDLSGALAEVESPGNDRWAAASGDSLRDAAEALFLATDSRGRPQIVPLAEPLLELLQDGSVRRAARDAFHAEVAAGRVAALPDGLLHLASVDTDGGSLTDGEDSALVALLRLISRTNTNFDCTVRIGWFDVDFSLGNLAVSILETLADADPSTVEDGVGLLGDVLGLDLSDSLLNSIADTRVCPVLDRQLVRDLHALDRLQDPEAAGLLRSLLGFLDATRPRIDALVETLDRLHTLGLVAPVEEVLRDLAGTQAVDDLVAMLPALDDPAAHHDLSRFPAGIDPVDFDLIWDLATDALATDASGQTPLDHLAGPVEAALSNDGTWTALHAIGRLLGDPRAELHDLVAGFPDVLAADPTLDIARDAADLLENDALVRPLLVVAEAEAPRNALASTEVVQPGPLPFTAQLVVGGTVDVLLDTIDALTTLLPSEEPDDG